MRKSTVIFMIGLWLLALLNMWLVMRLGEEHARAAESRARPHPWNDAPQSGYSIVIVNAPPDTPTKASGPSTRKITRRAEP
jgi:hypothetical protein